MWKVCSRCNQSFNAVKNAENREVCRDCIKKEINRRSYHKNKHKWGAADHRCIITKPCSICKKEVVKEVPITQVYDGQYTAPVYCSPECRKIRDRELVRIRKARYRAKVTTKQR